VDGAVQARIQIGDAPSPRDKRGPRGLALRANVSRLYVLNRISNTISVVDTGLNQQLTEVAIGSFDPTPTTIKHGRGFLYDAKLSGNGTASCSSCHVDAEPDLLAWDLGDPAGDLVTVNNAPPFPGPAPANPGPFVIHPMKGPMMTQSLRGLDQAGPLHWRGDRPNFQAFNIAYDHLLGGNKLSAADMNLFADAVRSILYAPNPNQLLDRSTPIHFGLGEPYEGFISFTRPPANAPTRTCSGCHLAADHSGTDLTFREVNELGEPQVFRVPQLRGLYMKAGFDNRPGADSITGFGFGHNGSEPTVFSLLSHEEFFGDRAHDTVDKNNLDAYMLCFDTGTPPAVGQTRTVNAQTVGNAQFQQDLLTMMTQTGRSSIELIAKGKIDGRLTGLLYRPKLQDFQTDRTGFGPFTFAALVQKVAAGGTLSFMGVMPGTGQRMGLDRDLDGALDGDAAHRAVHADFDGDGRTDISVFRPENGGWYILNSAGDGTNSRYWGVGSDRLVPADYDGDGKTDIAVYRNGAWHILRSQLGYITVQFGVAGDVPTPGDYDGDRLADLAVWRPADGTWYIVHSQDGFRATAFGAAGDRPVPDDYDGDGKQDLAVYRDGTWYQLLSQRGFVAVTFGSTTDRPVPGDYDGDGNADLAVFRPLDGTWYLIRSSDQGFAATPFGTSSDVAAPGDYDGDGKFDLSVFRPSDGSWYRLESATNQVRAQYWGSYQDQPIPAAFLH
jgi:YVTN family beta-propeller protein